MKLCLTIFIVYLFAITSTMAQDKHTGEVSLGGRNVISLFNDGNFDNTGMGMGGQFRVRLSEKINTEWFLDYITTDLNKLANRKDYHIGWSVMYYPTDVNKQLVPYVIAGHCFDYTRVSEYSNTSNSVERWSSAVQMGLGNHFKLTNKLDFSASAQYMIHMGGDIHVDDTWLAEPPSQIIIEKHEGMDLEGHILISLSINYNLGKLWSKKE